MSQDSSTPARWKPRGYLFFEEVYAAVFVPAKDRSLKNGEAVKEDAGIEIRRAADISESGSTQEVNPETTPREKPVTRGLASRYKRS